MTLTEGHLVRHFQGVKGGRDAALLDIAQDHALYLLHEAGLFKSGLVFKGGTALRKFRAGNAGRFSTDLDFAAPDDGLALNTLSEIDGAEVDGFTFRVNEIGDDGRRGELHVQTPFGVPNLGAKLELARHPLILPADHLTLVALPIHKRYSFTLPSTPVVRAEEAIAEKLARFRRTALVRDLYDLYWYAASGPLDEPLIRRLWILKTYRDVTEDGRGSPPISPQDILNAKSASDFAAEDIGYLTKRVNTAEWLHTVEDRFEFLAHMTDDERRWAQCNRRDQHEVWAALQPSSATG
ncbi:MAG: nucleotidyl transferase AbiEii/AbiGii toxin family protein [Candidatus Nanopelagicales bacterium]